MSDENEADINEIIETDEMEIDVDDIEENSSLLQIRSMASLASASRSGLKGGFWIAKNKITHGQMVVKLPKNTIVFVGTATEVSGKKLPMQGSAKFQTLGVQMDTSKQQAFIRFTSNWGHPLACGVLGVYL